MIDWPRTEVMSQMLRSNLTLYVGRAGSAVDNQEWNIVFVANTLVDMNLFYRGGNVNYSLRFSPLPRRAAFVATPRPNFNGAFLKTLSGTQGLPQTNEFGLPAGLTPEEIFHYAYAAFHRRGYGRRYEEVLKIDFPRLLLAGNLELFRTLARLGGELVALHPMESETPDSFITDFIATRNPEIEKPVWAEDTVWVDKRQTTGSKSVTDDVWNFHIGFYQVCHKWLKDRKGRTLADDDIAHYQKIIFAISETIHLMGKIEEVIEEYGGWLGAFQNNAS